jgi:prepilin-type processing-associated H-X9-DG protein
MALPSPQRRSARTTLANAIAWSVAGLIRVILLLVMLLPPVCVIPKFVADRTQCRSNLRVLGIAMHAYHDAFGSFPPAYLADRNGRPMHSWRVLLLPFMDHRDLYQTYRFDEPWNGLHNQLLASRMPEEFRCPADTDSRSDTSYFVVIGPRTVFPGAAPVRIKDITDGTVNTILLVEAADSGVNWLEPRDSSYEEAVHGINPKSGLGISGHHKEGANVTFVDGSVQFLAADTSVEQLRHLLERNDGQPVSLPYFGEH